MSNHFSAARLRYPGDDARLDLTDLFVFAPPDDPGQTVLIIDANPFMTGPEFHPYAVYRINIDTDGDLLADVAFTFTFSPPADGPQIVTLYYATGRAARQAEPVGEVLRSAALVGFDASAQPVRAGPVRLFTGVRSDPFFADAEGAWHGSGGPGTTPSPAPTSCASRWRCPTACSARGPRSESGSPSACAATASWCR
jgi:hypothetical protein